jgi:hypothetical protein
MRYLLMAAVGIGLIATAIELRSCGRIEPREQYPIKLLSPHPEAGSVHTLRFDGREWIEVPAQEMRVCSQLTRNGTLYWGSCN